MTQVINAVSWTESVGFALIGIAALVALARHRTAQHAWLALAIGLLGAISVEGRVQELTGFMSVPLGHVVLVAFLASGYALALFRDSVLPMRAVVRWGLLALLVGVSAVSVADVFPDRALARADDRAVGARLGAAPALVRLRRRAGPALLARVATPAAGAAHPPARAERRLRRDRRAPARQPRPRHHRRTEPAHQPALPADRRAHRRRHRPDPVRRLRPAALARRIWRDREEAALRRATGELLLATDPAPLAERSLDWAMRLVGADRGVIAGPGNEVLARRGVDDALAAELLAFDPGTGARLEGVAAAGGSRALIAPLPLSGEHGVIAVLAGPLQARIIARPHPNAKAHRLPSWLPGER